MVAGAGDGIKKILGAILIGIVVLAVAASILVRSFEDRVTEELVVQVSRQFPRTGRCWMTLSDASNSCV